MPPGQDEKVVITSLRLVVMPCNDLFHVCEAILMPGIHYAAGLRRGGTGCLRTSSFLLPNG